MAKGLSEVIAYCTQCGFSQGLFDSESDLRRKIAVQKKCPECGVVFGFLADGRIWNLRWEQLPSTNEIVAEPKSADPETENKGPKGFVEDTSSLNDNIFIVHGWDHEPVKDLMVMLNELGLNPIVLHEQASAGRTIAEKLEKYASKIGYAFVILTPDDVGGSKTEMRKLLGGDTSLLSRPIVAFGGNVVDKILDTFEPRARQNVIFEMGYFWGFLQRNKVCCLLKGNVAKPSDIDGIVYVHFEKSVNEVRSMIIKELNEAGYTNSINI